MIVLLMTSLAMFAAGALLWTFLEYAIHGWIGHRFPNKSEFRTEHMAHHRDNSYFTSARRKIQATGPVYSAVAVAAGLLVGWLPGLAFTAGLIVMYVAYEVLHRRAHTHPPRNFYSRWLRRHHFHHHFKNPRLNHGVTTPLWDLVFGTYHRPEQVIVPRKVAMAWLCDPETGEVWPQYAGEYALR